MFICQFRRPRLSGLFNREGEGAMILRNVSNHSLEHKQSHRTRLFYRHSCENFKSHTLGRCVFVSMSQKVIMCDVDTGLTKLKQEHANVQLFHTHTQTHTHTHSDPYRASCSYIDILPPTRTFTSVPCHLLARHPTPCSYLFS
jgi:hypothetical protein